ncbi:acyl carrier protein [Nostoc sp. MG11]|uniref:acyl carrier protein n=1 Tax=Nostoc sp. MG11 TaxID=2721166 RepID=UPI001867601C|nr:acyl carrier protein [Nostoc sp. MG11]
METQNLQENTISTVLESSKVNTSKQMPIPSEIQAWIVSYVANLLEVDSDEIDVTIPFDRYGLDSSAAVGLTGDLEDWLGQEIDPTLMYDYPTVQALVQHLSSQLRIN